jgi:peptidoglycan/xylan/chitin deacetylase (PgdA/CDA1 family)
MHSQAVKDAARIAAIEARAPPASRCIRALLRRLAPEGGRGKLTTLIFHRVHAEPDPLFPNEMHAASFRERLGWIDAWFNVLPLDDAIAALDRGTLPERALAITFDDGYADNFDIALPILREYGMSATFFIATGFLDGGRMWNDTVIEAVRRTSQSALDLARIGLGNHPLESMRARRDAIHSLVGQLKYTRADVREERARAIADIAGTVLPGNIMMTSAQVRALAAAGMTIGAHTSTHPILSCVDVTAARRDIVHGREMLEAIVGQPVRLFAYPNGKPTTDYGLGHVALVRDLGFAAAMSTSVGAARTGDSLFQLPRFTPWEATPARWAYRLVRNLFTKPAECVA